MIEMMWKLTVSIHKIYVLMSACVDIENNDVYSHKDVLIDLIDINCQ